MYHPRTGKKAQRDHRRFTGILAALVVVAILVCAALPILQQNLKEQGAEALRQSILSTATQCCAVEGAYPSSLRHLEEEYGLSINTEDYQVTYEVFAANVMPSVVVVPR
ncbi:MAG: hypothetical protein PUE49_01945 [Eggerthellales bacterium]|nr:hypothetical protein [Eggerthellales bacterium]